MKTSYEVARAAVARVVPFEKRSVAIISIDPKPYTTGDMLGIDREFRPVDGAFWLGFIDLEPQKNWGHRALVVIVRDEGTEVRETLFPPALEARRHFVRIEGRSEL
jgi:hypothetical protein